MYGKILMGRCIAVAAITTLLLWPTQVAALPLYSVTDLGTLGGQASFGTALNDNGHAVGYSNTISGATRAFYWTPGGGMQDMGLIGSGMSRAFDINNNDQVVGQIGGRAFRWTSGTGMMLLDGPSNGAGNGINNSNVVIGSRVLALASISLLWDASDAIMPSPVLISQGIAINDLNQWVGSVPGGGFYSAGDETRTMFAGAFVPTDLNDSREIVGSTGGIATLLDFDTNTTTSLGKLSPTDTSSTALGINQAGTIVGVSVGSGAFITDSTLTLISLNSLLDAGFAGWNIVTATDINNSGQIIGVGEFNGKSRAVILTPVPEPSSIVLFGLGLMGLSLSVRRRVQRRRRASA